jgi:energy-converting hydrogenase Eha subunit C
VEFSVTVYLSLFSCILLFFGGMGTLLAQDWIFRIAWGALFISGIVILVVTLYLRPGTDMRSPPGT